MRVDWCVSSWFRIKNTHSLTHRRTAWLGLDTLRHIQNELYNIAASGIFVWVDAGQDDDTRERHTHRHAGGLHQFPWAPRLNVTAVGVTSEILRRLCKEGKSKFLSDVRLSKMTFARNHASSRT